MRILALLAALFASLIPQPQTTTKNFNVTARQFAFDVTPSPFVVNEGDTVTLTLKTADVVHGFAIDELGISVDLIPGHTVTKTFVANTAGSFLYHCTHPECGGGHVDMNGTFVVNAQPAAPSITSFTPVAGPAAGGTSVTITGTNFQNGATVTFGDVAATSVTVNSSTSITAVAPAHASAIVTIAVTNPDGQSVSAGTFTFAAPPGKGRRRAVRQHG